MAKKRGREAADDGVDNEQDDPLAAAIGHRVSSAMKSARIGSAAELSLKTGVHERSIRRYLKGKIVPQVPALMAICQACHVSADWLLFGREGSTEAYLKWLASPAGQAAPAEARAFLARLPLFGYQPTERFYEFAHIAWRDGLQAEDIAQIAHDTDRETR